MVDPPTWMTNVPSIHDECPTASSSLQLETAEECLPFLFGQKYLQLNERGLPSLRREKHALFLQEGLDELPAGFAALDASRPWMFYWCLMGMSLLGEDVTAYRDSLAATLTPIQNADGGFGGGHGQYSHLATSYASVLSLCIVGGKDALDLVDRRAMWSWISSLKQADGDFQMSVGGERDVRGAYCAMTIARLLNLPMELHPTSAAPAHGHKTLDNGLAAHIANCQTYEGGIGSIPGAEAHGAYTFCALACLCLLGDPKSVINQYLDVPTLVSWLSARQHAPEGGLAGRSNKLVDGCYSHWIGGCWALVEAALNPSYSEHLPKANLQPTLFNKSALQTYVLCCCQGKNGGLRDKPSKSVDAYHTCYNLAGLSSTQHTYTYDDSDAAISGLDTGWVSEKGSIPDDMGVSMMHPVYVIPLSAVDEARRHFMDTASVSAVRPTIS